ncbi:hypothetical protein C5167_047989 [Papaver somniferum]|uniref:Uncharacterized protein n=1 Tax=Papaver somniferum TaxID=3469 RepID=A0A4Y7KJI4_PAPSO|nr:hypothetical protein C5167_047989 [Papaver somniferum]
MMDLLRSPVIHGGAVKSNVHSTQQKWRGTTCSECSEESRTIACECGVRVYMLDTQEALESIFKKWEKTAPFAWDGT